MTELGALDAIEDDSRGAFEKPKNAQAIPKAIPWARILSRIYDIDGLECDRCGQRMKPIAAVLDQAVITKILRHLGLPHEQQKFAPARAPP